MKPKVYMLCGLPGSGKTTYAKSLEKKNQIVRLSLDERLFKRYGKSFDGKKYNEYERTIENELIKELKDAVSKKLSVILDYGFWKKSKREEYRKLISKLDAAAEVVYFKADIETLKRRLVQRNSKNTDTEQYVSSEMLDKFASEFEEPNNEPAVTTQTA